VLLEKPYHVALRVIGAVDGRRAAR